MSLSVPVIAFPYCQYPYTFGQKCYYYTAVVYCGMARLMGVGIYSSYIRRAPLLTLNDVHSKTIDELKVSIEISHQNSMRNCIQFFICAIIGAACQYGFGYFSHDLSCYIGYDLSYYSKYWKYIKYYFGGLFTFGSIYNVLSNLYNSFVCYAQISIIKHGQTITRAINAMKKDFSELDDKFDDIPSIGKNIYSQINESKSSWKLFRSENDKGELTYVVSNNYYEHLIFVFNVYNTAVEFMKKLSELSIHDVEYLAENREEARTMRNQFIKTKLCSSLMYDYYVFSSNMGDQCSQYNLPLKEQGGSWQAHFQDKNFMSEHPPPSYPRRNKSELESLLADGYTTSCSNSFDD